jgi:hypothetical protein
MWKTVYGFETPNKVMDDRDFEQTFHMSYNLSNEVCMIINPIYTGIHIRFMI